MGSGNFDLVEGKDRGSANGSSRSSVRFISDIEPEICCPTIGGEDVMAAVCNQLSELSKTLVPHQTKRA